MPRLSEDQRIWMCLHHARIQNAAEAKRRWPHRWENAPSPTKQTITKAYQKFLQEATCHDLNKGRSGRRRTARTPENIELVRESLTLHGNRSSRRNGLGLSRSSFHRISKLDIRFHPCVMITRQELRDGDPVQRTAFCNQLVNTVEQNSQFLDQFIVSDGAVLSLNLQVLTRNVIRYSPYGDGHPADHYVEFAQGAD